jgi:hypothetical protein
VLPVVYLLQKKSYFIEHIRSRLRYRGQSNDDLRKWLKSVAKGSEREETYLTLAFRRFIELYIDVKDNEGTDDS